MARVILLLLLFVFLYGGMVQGAVKDTLITKEDSDPVSSGHVFIGQPIWDSGLTWGEATVEITPLKNFTLDTSTLKVLGYVLNGDDTIKTTVTLEKDAWIPVQKASTVYVCVAGLPWVHVNGTFIPANETCVPSTTFYSVLERSQNVVAISNAKNGVVTNKVSTDLFTTNAKEYQFITEQPVTLRMRMEWSPSMVRQVYWVIDIAKYLIDPWFNTTYAHQVFYEVNGTNYTVPNVPFLLNVSTKEYIDRGEMQADCDDLTFVHQNETVELPYVFDSKSAVLSGCGAANTLVWVRADMVNGTGNASIYEYHNASGIGPQTDTNVFVNNFAEGANAMLWYTFDGVNVTNVTDMSNNSWHGSFSNIGIGGINPTYNNWTHGLAINTGSQTYLNVSTQRRILNPAVGGAPKNITICVFSSATASTLSTDVWSEGNSRLRYSDSVENQIVLEDSDAAPQVVVVTPASRPQGDLICTGWGANQDVGVGTFIWWNGRLIKNDANPNFVNTDTNQFGFAFGAGHRWGVAKRRFDNLFIYDQLLRNDSHRALADMFDRQFNVTVNATQNLTAMGVPVLVFNLTSPKTPRLADASVSASFYWNDTDMGDAVSYSYTIVRAPNGTLVFNANATCTFGTWVGEALCNTTSWGIGNFTGYLGNWTVNATADDNSSESGSAFASFTFAITDAVKPELSVSSPVNNSVYRAGRNVSVNFTGRDNVERSVCWLTNSSNQNVTLPNCNNWTVYYSIGDQNLTLWENDTSNNVVSAYLNFSIPNDVVSPVLAIVAPVGTVTTRTNINLSYTMVDTATFDVCYRNRTHATEGWQNNLPIPCGNTSVFFSVGEDGENTLWISANDSFGNFKATSTIFTVDSASSTSGSGNPGGGGGGGGAAPPDVQQVQTTLRCNVNGSLFTLTPSRVDLFVGGGDRVRNRTVTLTMTDVQQSPLEVRVRAVALNRSGNVPTDADVAAGTLDAAWEWVSVYPRMLTLNPALEQRGTVEVSVAIPEGVAEGYFVSAVEFATSAPECELFTLSFPIVGRVQPGAGFISDLFAPLRASVANAVFFFFTVIVALFLPFVLLLRNRKASADFVAGAVLLSVGIAVVAGVGVLVLLQ